jgi:hypothetical protein
MRLVGLKLPARQTEEVSMHIERVTNKGETWLRELLLLADEQWSCV